MLLLQASLNQLEAEASGIHSSRSVRSSRALEGAVRLRDLASPVRPRSVHSPRAPSPSPGRRGGVPEEVVRRLEDHDAQQVEQSACCIKKMYILVQSYIIVFHDCISIHGVIMCDYMGRYIYVS